MPPRGLEPLADVFSNPAIRKIFHAAEYDLFVLHRHCGLTVRGLFDTMISAQLLGYPSVGLSRIAARHFAVNLPKDEQRSDWSRRPLTQQQMSYAASDVLHLHALKEKLDAMLARENRADLAASCFRFLPDRVRLDLAGWAAEDIRRDARL